MHRRCAIRVPAPATTGHPVVSRRTLGTERTCHSSSLPAGAGAGTLSSLQDSRRTVRAPCATPRGQTRPEGAAPCTDGVPHESRRLPGVSDCPASVPCCEPSESRRRNALAGVELLRSAYAVFTVAVWPRGTSTGAQMALSRCTTAALCAPALALSAGGSSAGSERVRAMSWPCESARPCRLLLLGHRKQPLTIPAGEGGAASARTGDAEQPGRHT